MGIRNAATFGLLGFGADLLMPGVTRGSGGVMGLMAGLLTPDARDMDAAYDPTRATRGTQTRPVGGQPMGETLFGDRPQDGAPVRPTPSILQSLENSGIGGKNLNRWSLIGGGLMLAGMMIPPLRDLVSLPLYFFPPQGIPYSPAGLIPMLHREGLVPHWGLLPGTLL